MKRLTGADYYSIDFVFPGLANIENNEEFTTCPLPRKTLLGARDHQFQSQDLISRDNRCSAFPTIRTEGTYIGLFSFSSFGDIPSAVQTGPTRISQRYLIITNRCQTLCLQLEKRIKLILQASTEAFKWAVGRICLGMIVDKDSRNVTAFTQLFEF